MRKNLFATTPGIIIVGAVIGLIAVWLQKLGNPANMGICVACFERDVAGGLGLHRAAIVQYLRPEIMGLVLGSLAAAIATREFKPRGGSAPIVRFVLGDDSRHGRIGVPLDARGARYSASPAATETPSSALPARAMDPIRRLFKKGYSLGRSNSQSVVSALFPRHRRLPAPSLPLLPPANPGLPEAAKRQPLFYSVKGPGSQHAPFIASLGLAFIIGIFAQRSRFCTMGAFRDLFLFRYTHLFLGLAAMFAAAFIANALTGALSGFSQPVAHSDFQWNYLGMVTAGLAFALAEDAPAAAVHGGGRRQRRRHFCPRHVGRRGYGPQSGHGQFRYGHRRIRYAGDDPVSPSA